MIAYKAETVNTSLFFRNKSVTTNQENNKVERRTLFIDKQAAASH